ncbi:MAG TPA: sigma-70 family RNA polymerase sigma factor, partial [Planctomycetota bacterium]|nr:sigma-70 family RNA polymerase sigma factor [Planctomycetota bacterium]
VWDGRCRFKTWLLTVTTNTCIDEIRDRQMRRADSTEDLGVGSADDGRADLEHDVTNAVGTLSAVERELIRLRINEGLTVKEIVEKTGMSEGTVNRRIAEAFAKLKKQLPGYGPRE